VGPVFATTSKAGLPTPLGLDGLTAAAGGAGVAGQRSPIPVLGIGGITADSVAEVLTAGADGVAVIGGIWNAPDPVAAARALAAAVRPHADRRGVSVSAARSPRSHSRLGGGR
jgi:thiamine-phosphate pyrophosphorylase